MKVPTILVSSVVLFFLAACQATQEVTFTGKDNGREITIQRDSVIVISLDSNLTTGYSWVITSIDANIIRQIGEATFQHASPGSNKLLGAGGVETFRFQVIHSGRSTLRLEYQRAWEDSATPADAFILTINVP